MTIVMRTYLQPFNSTSVRAVPEGTLNRFCKKRPNHCRSRIGQMRTVLIRQAPIFRNQADFIVATEKDRAHVANDDPVTGKTLDASSRCHPGRSSVRLFKKWQPRSLANSLPRGRGWSGRLLRQQDD